MGGLQLTPSTGLLTGPESISGGGLLDQFSAASILRGPAKHGFELPTTSGGEFRGASGGGAEFRAPELNGLSSMSQMQALLMGDGDEDELDVAALGVSELPSPGALDDFMFRLPG